MLLTLEKIKINTDIGQCGGSKLVEKQSSKQIILINAKLLANLVCNILSLFLLFKFLKTSLYILWMWLLAGTVPAFKKLLAGTVPAFKKLLAGTVPAFKRLLAGTHKFYFFGFFNTFYQKKFLPLKKIYGYLPLKGYWQVPIFFFVF